MANKILVARATKARLEEIKSTLTVNELVYSTDTGELGVKKADGNIEYFKNAADIDAIVAGKQDKLVAGANITINPDTNVISASSGGEGIDLNTLGYMNYAADIFYRGGHQSLFSNAWQDMKDSEEVLFNIPLELVAPNQDMDGFIVDLYAGTDDQLQALYDACVNGTITPNNVYYVNSVATYYAGDVSGGVGFPIPIYNFGNFLNYEDNTTFLIGDLTPLGMGLGLVLAKNAGVSIPNNNIVIQQGFEFENAGGIIISNSVTGIGGSAFLSSSAFFGWGSNNYQLIIPNSVTSIGEYAFNGWGSNNQPLIIPNSVTSIGEYAFAYWYLNNQPLVISNSVTTIEPYTFYSWSSNNQPLIIPNSVTSIGEYAFAYWYSNNQPLIIPNSVTSIGDYAFREWTSNNQPLIIPNSVTSIGDWAFAGWSSVPYIEIQAITPPALVDSRAFHFQNDAPIYVPDESVEAYKTAPNWSDLADRIFPISTRGNTYTKGEIDSMIGDIESTLDAILGV